MAQGGSRINSGGKRAGAGRKRVVLEPLPDAFIRQTQVIEVKSTLAGDQDPLCFLLAVMRDPSADTRARLEAARIAAPFMHARIGATGKKEGQKAAAAKVATGRFAPGAPPLKLVTLNK